MNNKGQVVLGVLIMTAVTIIIGAIFLTIIAQQVGETTSTYEAANISIGDASNSTTVYLSNMKSLSSIVVYNESGEQIIPSSNFTVTNNVVNDGDLTVSFLPTTGVYPDFDGYEWTVSGTAQPTTYISDGGSRGVAGLIIIFFALAILVVALEPTLRNKFGEMIGR